MPEKSKVFDHLRDQVQKGDLYHDERQIRVAHRLDRLAAALHQYTNQPLLQQYHRRQQNQTPEQGENLGNQNENNEKAYSAQYPASKAPEVAMTPRHEVHEEEDELSKPREPRLVVPRGLYLHGPVGTGKSMLMDNFYRLVTTVAGDDRKMRCHFHAFLSDVHQRIHRLKQQDLAQHGRNWHVDTRLERNPIHRVGIQLAEELSLLCLDEFQVTDVADALILSQLFSVLFTLGTVVVATSNRPPEDLYEGGLNRSYFLPFIDLLKRHCIVHHVQSDTDYRRVMAADRRRLFLVLDQNDHEPRVDVQREIDDLVNRLREGLDPTTVELKVDFQRTLTVENADVEFRVARFHFDQLCQRNLGASDYRAVASQFVVVVIEGLPQMTLAQHDMARRFITLVDELYEAKVALLCTAAASPDQIFVQAATDTMSSTSTAAPDDDDVDSEKVLAIDQAIRHGQAVGALASVRELSFAFRRAASRLTEMTSPRWWNSVLEQNHLDYL